MDFTEKQGTGAISALTRRWTIEEVQDLAREEGYEEGFDKGLKEGMMKANHLNEFLLKTDRFEDLKRSTVDPAYRDKLFKEFEL